GRAMVANSASGAAVTSSLMDVRMSQIPVFAGSEFVAGVIDCSRPMGTAWFPAASPSDQGKDPIAFAGLRRARMKRRIDVPTGG
ncbi:MAG: hypothetical protein NTX59_10090, partial [Elusimicrobia bacterium]|nr:hypothetical protein [Elusimicrobiota bacterium]